MKYNQIHTHTTVTPEVHMYRCGPMDEQLVMTSKKQQEKQEKTTSIPTPGYPEIPGTVRCTRQKKSEELLTQLLVTVIRNVSLQSRLSSFFSSSTAVVPSHCTEQFGQVQRYDGIPSSEIFMKLVVCEFPFLWQ